jgi:hypothetical protein
VQVIVLWPIQVCVSTALFGFVSELDHEQLFTAACLTLRAVMGAQKHN